MRSKKEIFKTRRLLHEIFRNSRQPKIERSIGDIASILDDGLEILIDIRDILNKSLEDET